ncbi:MAG: sulfite exporter TauE/SafE family protein [Spirochaetaceae bacterium]|jgi:sulfite exporter TauE/SafE/copper chaperone CopZ/plastocyanin domain-containing protein|nr:sulfite exporter TauE/SafE family protein [Spirochaetaceae bacterium]
MKTLTIRIGGMTCVNCQNRIETRLKNTPGIESARVSFSTGMAALSYDDSVITGKGITDIIEELDYRVLDDAKRRPFFESAGILIIILSLYVLLRGLGIDTLTRAFPLAEAGMGYGMLFVIGLVTSVHCIAMCGGINLSQCISPVHQDEARRRAPLHALLPSVLYNTGRVLSYTAIGVIVGALGQALTVSGRFQGAVQLLAGAFMVIMGLNMLGLFQGSAGNVLRRFTPRMPKIFTKKIQGAVNKGPLFIGLLNGLMPCGPLQAMQLYALSTGSPVAGGVSMFLFSAGTAPLMFGIGALSGVLSRKFTRLVMRFGAVLVTVMGMGMFSYGFGLSGISFDPAGSIMAALRPSAPGTGEAAFAPVIENGFQIVNSTLSGGRYPAITVQQGIPVRWTINAPQGSINGCNNRMIIREYGIEYRFKTGENIIEFTPGKSGRFPYSCWMGMIRSSITVLAEGESVVQEPDTAPVPAGVSIPVDGVAVAELREDGRYQAVTIKLRDGGFEPSIVVMRNGLLALWTINNDSLDPGNSRVVFPAYYTRLDIDREGDTMIRLLPDGDFEFSTGDYVFYGYVKTVDDLDTVDIEAVKAEVSAFETLIYPDVHFEAAAGCSGGCCAQ